MRRNPMTVRPDSIQFSPPPSSSFYHPDPRMTVRAGGAQFSPPPSSPLYAPIQNPMSVAQGGLTFSPPPTSDSYARIENRDRRRGIRMRRRRNAAPGMYPKPGPGPTPPFPPKTPRPSYSNCVRPSSSGPWYAYLKGGKYLAKIGGQKQSQGQILYDVWVAPQSGVPDGWHGWLPGCGTERLGRYRNQGRAMGERAISGVIQAAPVGGDGGGGGPTGPGNTWSMQDAISAGCCVFLDGQGGYLTCDPMTTGGNHPLHGLEIQVQAVNGDIVTVCHPTFTEQCWRLPACPEQKTPATCCVRLGSFEHNGLTFTGMIECSDPSDSLHGTPVMTGQPFEQNGQMVVSFDVGGDVTATLPVCALPPTGYEDQPELPPTDYEPPPVTCCVDATTTPPTLQQCSDPSMNGTPVEILDVDEQNGNVMVAVPWSSVPVAMPLCELPPTGYEPPDQRCPTCPPGTYLDTATGQCVTCPECPTCPPGYWIAPDGSCVQCPPGYLLDPATGECVPPGECPSCPECPPGGECPPCPECPPGGECPPCPECPPPGYYPPPDQRQPPWDCCDHDEDCQISPAPWLPHFPQPGPVPGCDPDDPCCFECSLDGAGTMANPCNPCRVGNGRRRVVRGRRRR